MSLPFYYFLRTHGSAIYPSTWQYRTVGSLHAENIQRSCLKGCLVEIGASYGSLEGILGDQLSHKAV